MTLLDIDSIEIPEGYELWESNMDIHILPNEDRCPFEHNAEWDCFCNPILLNKPTIMECSERPIYMHNALAQVRS